MMKSLLVIAMFALIGFSLTSAAAINLGDNEIPESMEDFKESFQKLFRDISEQIKENADFDENTDFASFVQENKLDDEEASIVTEEEKDLPGDELSAVEDDRSSEKVDSGIHCSWHGVSGHCCQGVRIFRIHLSVCLRVIILRPNRMHISLILNNVVIWKHTLASRHHYRVCLHKGHMTLCFHIYNLYVSSHKARACLGISIKYHFIHLKKGLGCFYRHFAADEISVAKERPPQFLEKQKNIDDLISIPKEKKQSNDFLRFD